MEQALPTGGVLWRMLGAWADLRGSMRAELDRAPSEGRLLFFAMFAGLVPGPIRIVGLWVDSTGHT